MSAWDEKVILVTGGSAGLGLAIASSFARRHGRVVLAARSSAKLEHAVLQLQEQAGAVTAIAADVTSDADVRQLVQQVRGELGRLDVLVNAAGQSDRGRIENTSPEQFTALWNLNFLGMVRCTQAALPLLKQSRGIVVNIGSLAGKIASPYLGGYAASKFPVSAFSQQLRLEISEQGVHVLLVCPGPLARDDAGRRYVQRAGDLPDAALQPGGGAKLRLIAPAQLAEQIVRYCEQRKPELVVPWKARVLFAISQLWPTLGDRMLQRVTS